MIDIKKIFNYEGFTFLGIKSIENNSKMYDKIVYGLLRGNGIGNYDEIYTKERFPNYTVVKNYSYDEFYKAAEKTNSSEYDLFYCKEKKGVFIPCENELVLVSNSVLGEILSYYEYDFVYKLMNEEDSIARNYIKTKLFQKISNLKSKKQGSISLKLTKEELDFIRNQFVDKKNQLSVLEGLLYLKEGSEYINEVILKKGNTTDNILHILNEEYTKKAYQELFKCSLNEIAMANINLTKEFAKHYEFNLNRNKTKVFFNDYIKFIYGLNLYLKAFDILQYKNVSCLNILNKQENKENLEMFTNAHEYFTKFKKFKNCFLNNIKELPLSKEEIEYIYFMAAQKV